MCSACEVHVAFPACRFGFSTCPFICVVALPSPCLPLASGALPRVSAQHCRGGFRAGGDCSRAAAGPLGQWLPADALARGPAVAKRGAPRAGWPLSLLQPRLHTPARQSAASGHRPRRWLCARRRCLSLPRGLRIPMGGGGERHALPCCGGGRGPAPRFPAVFGVGAAAPLFAVCSGSERCDVFHGGGKRVGGCGWETPFSRHPPALCLHLCIAMHCFALPHAWINQAVPHICSTATAPHSVA